MDSSGKLKSVFRTFGNHRRYNLSDITKLYNKDSIVKKVIGYSRVSTFDQKKDLKVQSEVISNYIKNKYNDFEIIEDLGSGLNYNKRGLRKLIKMICEQKISVLVLTHKDRLLRFGSEIIINLCERFNVKVEIINTTEEETFEQSLCNDVLSIITVFSAKLHGKRSHKNQKLLESL